MIKKKERRNKNNNAKTNQITAKRAHLCMTFVTHLSHTVAVTKHINDINKRFGNEKKNGKNINI